MFYDLLDVFGALGGFVTTILGETTKEKKENMTRLDANRRASSSVDFKYSVQFFDSSYS